MNCIWSYLCLFKSLFRLLFLSNQLILQFVFGGPDVEVLLWFLFEAEEVVFTGCTTLDLFEAVRFAFLFVLDLAISQILLRTQNITSAFSTEQGLLHTHTQQRKERAHLIRNVPPKHPSFSITKFTISFFTN